MAKVVSIKNKRVVKKGRGRRLAVIKEELLRFHGIDLDHLLASEPAKALTVDEYEDFAERILEVVDEFCEEHPHLTIHDIFYTLENVKDIIKDNCEENEAQ
ncbi:MAG: hypothetical protein PHT49_00900 [Desulfovibrionales bacterium]|nr:hypothetical protein [Desulfovibrionales bacterium]